MLSGELKTQNLQGSSAGDRYCDSMAMNFSSTRLVVGSEQYSNNGIVKIYDYQDLDAPSNANTWQQIGTTISGGSNDKLGKCVDMNWSGDRIIIGAPGANEVRVVTDISAAKNWSTTVSNVISAPTSGITHTDFGFCVSIAKGDRDIFAVGCPENDIVYMYEFNYNSDTWDQTWSNVNTDVINMVQYDDSSNLYMTSNAASYGRSISLSGFGEFLAIGAPGTRQKINSTTAKFGPNCPGKTEGNQYDGTEIRDNKYMDGDGSIYQSGYMRCFNTSNVNQSWRVHSEISDYGQLLRGYSEDNVLNFAGTSTSQAWSLPAFGFSVAMSLYGDLVVASSPYYSITGNELQIFKGKAQGFKYTTNAASGTNWSQAGITLTSSHGWLFGWDLKMDYNGQRVAIGSCRNGNGSAGTEAEGGINVFDYNGKDWYENWPGSICNVYYGSVAVAISDGKLIPVAEKATGSIPGQDGNNHRGTIKFYNAVLSGILTGNNLVSGYLAADSIYIGPNDNTLTNDTRKRLTFGGTYNDNLYEATEIENRAFNTSGTGEGQSELFIHKKSIGIEGNGGRDMIRLKANEICLNSYNTRGHGTSVDDGKYDHYPALTVTDEGMVKLNAEFLLGKQNGWSWSSCDAKAQLDINGDTFCRRKLNAGHKDRSNTRGLTRELGVIFYDTRDRDIINGTSVYSNVPISEEIRRFTTGTITGTVTYNDTESAFKIGTDTSYIHNTIGGYAHAHESLRIACWIKLTKDNNQYQSVGETILSAGDLSSLGAYHVKCQIYNGGVQLKWGSGRRLRYTSTALTKDKWHHLFFYINKPNETQSTSNNHLWIDGNKKSLTSTGSTATTSTNSNHENFYVGDTHGKSIVDAYIGMVHVSSTHNGVYDSQNGVLTKAERRLTPMDLYTNGPPSERLSVGGDAYIEQKLGIANVVPMYPLDVTGDINFTGTLRQNNSNLISLGSSSSAGAPLQVLASKFTSNTSPTDNGILLKQEGYSSTNHAIMAIEVANANSGDPFVSWNTNEAGGGWCMGIDNDANDKLKIANSKDSLDSDTHMEFSSSGTNFKKAILANGSAGTNGQVLTSGGGGTVSWTTVSGGGGGSSLSGTNTFEWGTGVSGKETNAGKIGYSTWSSGTNDALDIVGAGTSGSNRSVRIWDKLGIGTSSPEAQLHTYVGDHGESNVYIQAYSDSSGNRAALFLGTPHYNDSNSQPKCAIIADAVGWSRADLHFCVETTANNGTAYRASTSNSKMMIDGQTGYVGIGTNGPGALLDVNGSTNQGSFGSGSGRYFNSGTGSHVTSWSGSAQFYWSIRASNSIGCGNSIICHNGTWNSSDSRIKTNINDVTDASALEKIRLLKPKTYKYIDTNEQGDTTVYGFIAQEVSNVFPEAVKISVKAVPNIYELSNVSDSNVITFTNFNTSDLLTSNVTSKIEVKSVYDKIENLTLDTVIDSKSIRVKEDLTNIIGSVDDTGNVVSGNQVFVMGQEVDNFNVLKKEYIFTIATAALQEVDRQLQAEKTKVATLETQVANLLARVTALENA
jgi:hypothetical protein